MLMTGLFVLGLSEVTVNTVCTLQSQTSTTSDKMPIVTPHPRAMSKSLCVGKLLGHPHTVASAQLRLMLPIAGVSAFLNNTPVVAVMIPIVQRWAENINVPKEQVIVPFSHVRTDNLRIFGVLTTRYMD